MAMKGYDRAVAMGQANAEALELTRRHCLHARIEAVGGNSFVGSMLGLPMGLLEVRCEHALPPRTQGHQALELAIEFYRANCPACPHRKGTGELPNLATVAGQRAVEEATRNEAGRRAADERTRRHTERRDRRHQLLAGEGYVVRDLGGAIDRIDRAEPRTEPLTLEDQGAAREVRDAARNAPELFLPVLVDSLLELAQDAADATAFQALEALVRSGNCRPRRALVAALAVLTRLRSVDAGRLLAVLEPELLPADLPDVLDQLIALASEEQVGLRETPSSPEGLIAASRVDLPTVTERIIDQLRSDDERRRQAAADAARELLAVDPKRIVALGPPLAASVRGAEQAYFGYPHPTSAALRALAEGWRGEPQLTRGIIESEAARAGQGAKDELSRVPWFLQRFREPWDAGAEATSEAISFVVQRAAGDWGDEAADHAADHLEGLVRHVPGAVAAHTDEMLGTILTLCAPDRDAPALPTGADVSPMQVVERDILRNRRDARCRRLARTVGSCASVDPVGVIGAVQLLFSATTGNDRHDRTVRATMLEALEAAVSPETLRDILPTTYSALLDRDQVVRGCGIDLWVACADVADPLPFELTELSVALLQDPYVVVHRRMLKQISRLRLPRDLGPRLLPIIHAWMVTYAKNPNSEVIESAIWALRSLARNLESEEEMVGWFRIALDYVGQCGPYARRDLLTAWWPEELSTDPAWAKAAIATAASPDLVDYYNRRQEPLLQALMDRPQLVTGIPLAEIEVMSTVHGPGHPWRALEPVELLQSAGRWADAAALAARVEAGQPPGEEGEPGRRLAASVARGSELAEAMVGGPPGDADLAALTDAVTTAVTEVEAARAGGVKGGPLRATLDGLLASVSAVRVLLPHVLPDATAAAEQLDQAALQILGLPRPHASGRQRQWLGRAWQIAAVLLRYDAAVRALDEQAPALLQGAKRQAEVLRSEMSTAVETMLPDGPIAFLTEVDSLADPGAAQRAWGRLGVIPAPVSLVGSRRLPGRLNIERPAPEPDEPPRAVYVATLGGVPVTDVLVPRRGELYHLGMTVRLLSTPAWAERCIVEPVGMLGRDALTLPRYDFALGDGTTDEFGITVADTQPLVCLVEQPIRGPALDCPVQARLLGGGQEQVIEVVGFKRLQLRPFDPSRDALTEHQQTDARLLTMFAALDEPDFDTEDVRAFCRLFAACVRAAQVMMFEKTFKRGTHVSEAQFHNELERLLRADLELEGRLTRRDAVAGGYDDLLHDDVIAELKVSHGAPVTVEDCVRYLGQPTQYGVGRGSQLSVLVVFDHGGKEAPPGVIDNYIGWLKPRLHCKTDPKYPSMVGVLIVNSNLPVPSAWSRRRIDAEGVG
jgi:hypothetical protein